MNNAKTNPYTGLPDDLYDTYAEVRIYEHPVSSESIELGYGGSQYPRNIEIPEGWELVCFLQTEKYIKIRDYNSHHAENRESFAKITVPVYVVGRRRDDTLKDYRERMQKAEQKAYDASIRVGNLEQHKERLEETAKKLEARIKELEEVVQRNTESFVKQRRALEKAVAEAEREVATLRGSGPSGGPFRG